MHRRLPSAAAMVVAFELGAYPSIGLGQSAPEDTRRIDSAVTTVRIDYAYSTFGGAVDPWHAAALSLGARNVRGTLIGRVDLARRFATLGAQYQVDAYPTLGKNTSGYLNAGFSRATIFPGHRYGAELFRKLPHASAVSMGVRSLTFLSERVTLFTGSLSGQTGNYWLSIRPFVRQQPAGHFTSSATVTARRYYGDPDTYIGGHIGAGPTPSDELDPSQLARENSMSMGLEASHPGSTRTVTTWIFNYERDKNPVRSLNRWEFGLGMKVRL